MSDVAELDPDTEAEPSAPPPRRSSAWIAWTLVVALAVATALAVVQWRSLAGPAAAVDAASDAATDYVLTLSTWDASEGLEPVYAALVAGATEEFAPEVDEVFGDDRRAELVAADAVSTGSVEEVIDGQPAEGAVSVVVIVEQLVVTGPRAEPVGRTERVVLLRMVDQSGEWLVDDLELLSELQLVEEDQ